MAITLAFDVYGTLVDTNGITDALRHRIGERAPAVSRTWREKQLEYAFRRTIMDDYADFADCIRQALEFTLRVYNIPLTVVERERLLEAYQRLPAFVDAEPGMEALQRAGYCAYAFSNGSREVVSKLLGDNGLRQYFEDIVSVEEMSAFKPSPSVYADFLARTGAQAAQTWLISGNPFDIIGARAVGWQAVWVRRLPNVVYDPWGKEPNATVSTLTEMSQVLPSP